MDPHMDRWMIVDQGIVAMAHRPRGDGPTYGQVDDRWFDGGICSRA